MEEREVPVQDCIECGYRIDTTANMFGARFPKPGDITVCIKCGHLTAFDFHMKQRKLTDEEMLYISGDKRLLAIQEARGRLLKEMEEKGQEFHVAKKEEDIK